MRTEDNCAAQVALGRQAQRYAGILDDARVLLATERFARTTGDYAALSDVTDAPVAGCSQSAPNVCATD